MNVLVTGGTGFLGSYVMAALEAAGHVAFAYDVASPSVEMLHVAPSLAQRFRPGQIGDIARLFDVCRTEKGGSDRARRRHDRAGAVAGAAAAFGDTLTPLEAQNVKMRAPLDIAAAKRVLGWSPQWKLEDGIRDYAERFREYIAATKTPPSS
jgi:nucleoside-diphosphate-sugar epimerase